MTAIDSLAAESDQTPQALLTNFRNRFPGAQRYAYMDVAARGLLSVDAKEALDQYLRTRMFEGGDKAQMFAAIARTREHFAELIGAAPDDIAFTKNVSEGLNAIIAAFAWTRGDRIVYCPELEHPNNVYPWRQLVKTTGVELIPVSAADGEIPVQALLDAIDDRTRMVTVSSVSFAPGLVTDLRTLGAGCRAHDVFLLVDAVQSVGLLSTNVDTLNIDALAVSTQKGLLSLYGMGFLYCRAHWAEQLEPAYLARFSVDLGDAHEAALGADDYRLMPGARRFEIGNYNFAGAAAADASLQLLLALSPALIEAHVRSLAARLAEGLLDLDLPVIGPRSGEARGTMVCVGEFGAGGHDNVDDRDMRSLHDHWYSNDVRLSIRRGLLRLSLHAYNNLQDVERVIALAKDWRKGHPHR